MRGAPKGSVRIVEMLPAMMPGAAPYVVQLAKTLLIHYGYELSLETGVCSIGDDGITVRKGDAEETIAADSIILATGFRPDTKCADLKGSAPLYYNIGDCASPRNVNLAIHEAYTLACAL